MQEQRQMTTLIYKKKALAYGRAKMYYSILVHTLLSMLPKSKLSFWK